jgi:integrase
MGTNAEEKMGRTFKRLTAREVMHAAPPRDRRTAMLPDGGNLYLQLSRSKAHPGVVHRSFVFRYELAGRRHDLGIGGTHTVTLAEAREKARKYRQDLLDRVDPLLERRKQHQALIAERARAVTFKDVATAYLNLHLESFKNAKHRQQWGNTLKQYVFPKLGHMTVADIGPADVLRVIEPHWTTKRATMSRVRQRIKKVLDYATERQLRVGENPAAGITSLPRGSNGRKHHPALPYAELPAFMVELRERNSLSARALEFTILTAARTGETRGALWAEVDFDKQQWIVPAERMKAGKEHRVPLCARAMEILRGLDKRGDGNKIFPLSQGVMLELLKGIRADITAHGFRSTFSDWCHEQTTAFPKAVIDMALAHAIGDKVEAAYRRGDLFQKRRKLMDAWAAYCGRPPADAKVISIVAAH